MKTGRLQTSISSASAPACGKTAAESKRSVPSNGAEGFERTDTGAAERRPYAKAGLDEKSSLLGLRAHARSEGLSYDQGSLHLSAEGRLSFVDLTMEQVELAQLMCLDPGQQGRLAELNTRWPGGADVGRPGSYVELAKSGGLDAKIERLKEIRSKDAFGVFRRGRGPLRIGGKNLNVGEEREISGQQGTGTVYFSNCSMACSFCQYADIARMKGGDDIAVKDLARSFLELQDRGAHNIQLMTPSHFVVEILEAVKMAATEAKDLGFDEDLKIPLVYNTGGYEDLDALRELEGVVDVYLPDVKFGSNEAGRRYGGVEGYWDNVQAAVREMHRQVGDLETDERGVATRGLLVRHLVMPNDAADTRAVAGFLGSVSKTLAVNVMDQWTPTYLSFRTPEIHREVSADEAKTARAAFEAAGLRPLAPVGTGASAP